MSKHTQRTDLLASMKQSRAEALDAMERLLGMPPQAAASNPDNDRNILWRSIYDEVKPYEYWPNDASYIATYLCEWKRTKNYFYITQVNSRLRKHSIRLTPIVDTLLADADACLMDDNTRGAPATARKNAQLEGIYCFMLNLMHKRDDMPLRRAALYAATEYKGIFIASTLQKKYKAEFEGSEVQKDLCRYIEQNIPYHYDMWTQAIEAIEPDKELKGKRR